ncbi:MAG: biosynthetic arginine decarboxylase [Phycisphaerales bacterium]|nr:biosynthetic arginine decarboxylase [Phycisphaerales bacterium]
MTTMSQSKQFLHGRFGVEDAALMYGIPDWGKGYVGVNKHGHAVVMPDKDPKRVIDLFELVKGLGERDIYTPVLVRFPQTLHHRAREIHGAFAKAIEQESYKGSYRCVYPIKVNQQRGIVEELRNIGSQLGFGLEAGSKPELLAVLGMTVDHPEMPIVCNGFKDREFLEGAVLATKLGRTIIPVIEDFSELEKLIDLSEKYGVRPNIGLRAKVSTRSIGRWESSAGARSKFGLTMSEILSALEFAKSRGMADCIRLLHFHLGSQICDIRSVKNAVTELAHIYAELRRLGAGVDMIDIGGGLGVDYDGSQSAFESSMNYTVEEYARDIVYRIKAVCEDAGQPHPTIISESGRALVAYSSVLIFDVLGSSSFDAVPVPYKIEDMLPPRAADESTEEIPQPVVDLFNTYHNMVDRNLIESYHDAMQARDEVMSLFTLGYLSLPLRAMAENLFWSIGWKLMSFTTKMKEVPEEFESLPEILSDHYFCNMSVFQSMPDSWAIDQLFPICPIHRLNEEPTRRGVLADITCDSDGKIEKFVGGRDIKRALELHRLKKGEPYYLAAFLVGAYQEILGDLHNLLGDTHAVQVTVDDGGHVSIDDVIPGDTVAKALSYVQIDHVQLRRDMRRDAERAVRAGKLTAGESGALMRFYESGLDGYTYLEE